MAEETNPPQDNEQTPPATGGGSGKFIWLAIAIGVAAACAGAGLGLGKLLAGPRQAEASTPEQSKTAQDGAQPADNANQEFGYVNFDPIAVNLSGPRMDRHVRVTIVLAIDKSNLQKAQTTIEDRKPELRSWLTVFLSGCTIEDVRGADKLNRLRRQIHDALNERLWPNSAPMISRVLFSEFVVQ